MPRLSRPLLCFLAATALFPLRAVEDNTPIDVQRGRALMQRWKNGDKLNDEEQAYLERVKQEIRKRSLQKASAMSPVTPPANPAEWDSLVPITEMTAPYKGEDGGLYGGGRNEPPEAHRAAYAREAARIRPLDAKGEPAADGKIGFITIGFSNTNLESEDFKRAADADPQKSKQLIIVNGAIGSRSAVMWAYDGADALPKPEQDRLDKEMDLVGMPKKGRKSAQPGVDKDTWPTLEQRIAAAGLSDLQVQVLWMKHVEAHPRPLGDFPAHARTLQADMTDILVIAKKRFPNLRVAYLSSRTYAGWSGPNSGSPEPFAYESGFGTRWLVQAQIKGDPELNFDPAHGEVKAPLVLWGPYLWANGDTPRKLDGLTWPVNHFREDHLHPNAEGCSEITKLLLGFFKTDTEAARWFTGRPRTQ